MLVAGEATGNRPPHRGAGADLAFSPSRFGFIATMTGKSEKCSTGLVLTRDLLFSTKITGTARALGLDMQVVASVDDLKRRLQDSACGCILIDLSLADVSVADVVEAAGKCNEGRPALIAFGSHVDTARLQQAEAAGCDEVMPRSRFVATLPELLGQYLSSDHAGGTNG